MPFKNLIRLAFQDFFSRKGRLFLSIIGIVCGVASLVFLLSLIESVRQTVKNELIGKIPITEMIIKPKEKKMLYWLVADYAGFNDDIIEFISTLHGVEKVYPVQALEISTEIEGKFKLAAIKAGSFNTEAVVFGVPKEVVLDGLKDPSKYVFNPFAEKVPAIISKGTLDIYNIGFAKIVGYGRFHETALLGQEFILNFGKMTGVLFDGKEIAPEKNYGLPPVKCRIVGVSKNAPISGISVPLEYIQYWRERYYKGDKKAIGDKKIYEYAIVNAKNIEDVEDIQAALEEKGFEVKTQKETLQKINSISFIISLVFGIFGIIILVISAISIFNILTMSVNEEKVDIAILRAVGARKSHIRVIYLLKAGLIGLIGAIDGIIIGYILMSAGNKMLLKYFKNYPFVPESFFEPTWQIVGGCFLLGFLFSVAAGVLPANYAARLKPAIILKQN